MNNKKQYSVALVCSLLMLTIVIDALGVGLVFPVFASIFAPSSGILPPGTPETICNVLYGITLAAFPIGMFMGAPVLGDLSDHWGRKKVLLMCLYAEFVFMWLCGFALYLENIPFIIFFRFLTGIFAGSMGIAQAAVVDISPAEKKTKNLSLISIAVGVGFAVGPIAGSFLAFGSFLGLNKFSIPFFVTGIIAFVNATLLLISFKETAITLKSDKIVFYKGFILFLTGITSRRLKEIAIALLLIQTSWALYFQTSSLLMVEVYKYNIGHLGLFISFIATIYSFTLIVVVRVLGKYFSLDVILKYSAIFLAIGLGIAAVKYEVAAWISVVPIAASAGLAYLAIITLLSNSVGKKSQGWVMGIAGSVVAVGSCFGSIIAGLFTTISFQATYIAGAVLPLITFFIVLSYIKKKPAKLKITK